jgi:hypothetical protein
MPEFCTTFEMNTIVIVDSLWADDLHTAKILEGDLRREFAGNLNVERHSVRDKAQVFSLFKALEKRCRKDSLKPLLHLDCHGNQDHLCLSPDVKRGQGNQVPVPWTEFMSLVREVNRATKNNLLLVSTACQSIAAATKTFAKKLDDVMPAFCVLAPADKPKQTSVDWTYLEFYKELFKTGGDLGSALTQFWENPDHTIKIQWVLSERLFFNSVVQVLRRRATPEQRQELAKQLLTERPPVPNMTEIEAQDALADGLRPENCEDYFNRKKLCVLMSGETPNAGRFPTRFEDALQAAAKQGAS